MKQGMVKWVVFAVFSGLLMMSCASTKPGGTKLRTWVDKDRRGTPVSNLLVMAVTEDEGTRRSFESKFVAQLKAAGIEAVSSADVIPISADRKLEKDVILKAVNEFENDAVIITHLVGVEEKDVYEPAPGRRFGGHYGYPHGGYYGHYVYAYDAYGPRYDRTDILVRLGTNLYDVKTEQIIWSGQSRTWNPGTDKHMIDEVIKVVINDLHKNKLLPQK